MSLDHLNNSRESVQYEIGHQEDQSTSSMNNKMYDKEKHINPHDIAGQPGLVMSQAVEFEKKKVQYRVANELYLRKHPELSIMLSIFLFRVLEEKPEDLLTYAGKFFDQPNLKEIIAIQRNHYLENGNATK